MNRCIYVLQESCNHSYNSKWISSGFKAAKWTVLHRLTVPVERAGWKRLLTIDYIFLSMSAAFHGIDNVTDMQVLLIPFLCVFGR